ncbi:uncharacterized protein [Miscanthus floridulus]|uniref:uncharacterized protein n=1 Tax=Miscanthus floridulus TaxID=154761 RepID=UPI00345762C1
MRLGGGRKHGRTWIANAAIDPTTVPTLSQLRAQSTSSSQPIRSRPTPTLQRVDALEAQNNEKTAQITALTARLEAEQAAREAPGGQDCRNNANHASSWAEDGCACADVSSSASGAARVCSYSSSVGGFQ